MARRIVKRQAEIPAGQSHLFPLTYDMSFPPMVVTSIFVRIPPGPNGNVGFQIANSGQQIIPYDQGEFIIGNDDRITWDLSDYIDSGDWQLIGYNEGLYQHTIYVTFALDLITAPDDSVITAPPLSALSTLPTPDQAAASDAQAELDALLAELGTGAGPS